jgi:hypothetical protein
MAQMRAWSRRSATLFLTLGMGVSVPLQSIAADNLAMEIVPDDPYAVIIPDEVAAVTSLQDYYAAISSDDPAQALSSETPSQLEALPGYTWSRPRFISEWGPIAGQVVRQGEEPAEQALVWKKRHDGGRELEPLPPLPGFLRGDARGFARLTIPIGFSYLDELRVARSRAVAWPKDPTSGQRVALDLEPPPGFTGAQANAANALGWIVGEAISPGEVVNGQTLRHAVVWRLHGDGSHQACDLGVPGGFDVSSASDINEFGLVVGTARRFEPDGNGGVRTRADVVVWWPSGFPDPCPFVPKLLPAREDLPLSQNPAISLWGQVVARADRVAAGQPTVSRALLWRWSCQGYQEPVELPVPQGFSDAFARDVDARGRVLGTAQVRPGPGSTVTASRAVVWKPRCGGNWQALVLASPNDTALVSAERMNEWGDVVGTVSNPTADSTGGLLWHVDNHFAVP